VIDTVINRNEYAGAGSTGPFAFNFRIFAASDLLVIRRSSLGVETVLAYPADFTVPATDVGKASGSITTTANVAAGETLVIRRAPPLKQEVDLRNQGPFFPESYEDAVDKLAAQIQYLKADLDLALRLGESYDPAAFALRLPRGVGGQFLGWNSAATAITNVSGAPVDQTRLVAYNLKVDGGCACDGAADDRQKAHDFFTSLAALTYAIVDVPGIVKIGSNLTVPANIALRFLDGRFKRGAAGVVLTIAGSILASPHQQIFDSSVSYATDFVAILSKKQRVHFEWWGAIPDGGATDHADAMQAAINTRASIGMSGVYGFAKTLTGIGGGGTDGGQVIEGLGMQVSQFIVKAPFVGSRALLCEGGPNGTLRNVKVEGIATVDNIEVTTDYFHLQNVFTRNGKAGVLVKRCNLGKWFNVHAESCVDGYKIDPSSDDVNGNQWLGLSAFGCTGWAFWQEKGAGANGPLNNHIEVFGESCGNGIHIRDGWYGRYTLYVEGITADDFDLAGNHEFFLQNVDNDSTAWPFGGAVGHHGTGGRLKSYAGDTLSIAGAADPSAAVIGAKGAIGAGWGNMDRNVQRGALFGGGGSLVADNTARTLIQGTGGGPTLYVIAYAHSGGVKKSVDLVLLARDDNAGTTIWTVVATLNAVTPAVARTYSSVAGGEALKVALNDASATYNIRITGIGANELGNAVAPSIGA
jgi:hypothetical protein